MSKEETKELPLIKHLLDKIGDSDIVPTRKVTTIAGDSKIKRIPNSQQQNSWMLIIR